MKRSFFAGLLVVVLSLGCKPTADAQVPAPDVQVAAALQAAPSHFQDGATVLGYGTDGKLTPLQDGSGELICLADDPADERFSVACYHKDLEPFMARGRALRAEGKERGEVIQIREQEIAAGTLPMPALPTTLYVLSGDGFDPATGTVQNGALRFVIYTPFATPETTGLSTTPTPGVPWLMDPGKATAHIMIIPARPGS